MHNQSSTERLVQRNARTGIRRNWRFFICGLILRLFTFFSGFALLYKVNILSLMMDMSMLAPTSPQSLYPSSWHANTLRIFPAWRHLCWRRPPRKAFILCRGTPTCSGFFRPDGIFVGADLSAKPLSFVVARQHAQDFSGLPAPKNERTCIRKAISAWRRERAC